MKISIIGSRDFDDYNLLKRVIDNVPNISVIISGGAKGADELGEKYAKDNNIPTKIFHAEWNKYGKAAGIIRNEYIIKESDCVFAFWDGKSRGTKHSISLAKKMKKEIFIINF